MASPRELGLEVQAGQAIPARSTGTVERAASPCVSTTQRQPAARRSRRDAACGPAARPELHAATVAHHRRAVDLDAQALVDRLAAAYALAVSLVEPPEEPHLRLYTVDDERLWAPPPRLRAEEFALRDVTDEEWEAFYSALADV